MSHFSPAVADTKKLLHMQADNSKGEEKKVHHIIIPNTYRKQAAAKKTVSTVLYILSINLDWIKG